MWRDGNMFKTFLRAVWESWDIILIFGKTGNMMGDSAESGLPRAGAKLDQNGWTSFMDGSLYNA